MAEPPTEPCTSEAARADLARALKEVLRHFPDSRERLTEAKTAVEAIVRAEHARVQEVEQANRTLRKDLQEQRQRYQRLRLALLTGGTTLPRSASRTVPASHLLMEAFFTARNELLALAQALHEATQKTSAVNWQVVLARSVFVEAAPALLEALMGRPSPVDPVAETRILCEHQQQVVDAVVEQVKKAGKLLDDPLQGALQRLARNALVLVWDVLVASPPGWFILPVRGTPYDPAQQQTIPGRPTSGAVVGGVLFPGYVLRGTPDKVVEKAQVFTEAAQGVDGGGAKETGAP